jgi:hypothetical protein
MKKKDGPPLNLFAMAAHYSPNPKSKEMGVDLPFDLKSGEMLQKVWNRWLSWDPVRMVEKYYMNEISWNHVSALVRERNFEYVIEQVRGA